VNWGILTCGKVSSDFAYALKITKGANIVACAARNLKDAQDFAKLHSIPKSYGSYKELVEDPSVQVVYVGSIHVNHMEHALLALNHGKHVVVEKPMGINKAQTEQMYKVATEKNLYIIEGMWTGFFPAFKKAKSLIDSGAIGTVQFAQSNFGVVFPKDIPRIWDPKLGGGAFLDIGIYPLYAIILLLSNGEEPLDVQATASIEGGIDIVGSALIRYSGNKLGIISWNALVAAPETTTVVGTKGIIRINAPCHAPVSLTIIKEDKEENLEFPLPESYPGAYYHFVNSAGFSYEASEVQNDILAGKKESNIISWKSSLAAATIIDKVKTQIGLKYPSE